MVGRSRRGRRKPHLPHFVRFSEKLLLDFLILSDKLIISLNSQKVRQSRSSKRRECIGRIFSGQYDGQRTVYAFFNHRKRDFVYQFYWEHRFASMVKGCLTPLRVTHYEHAPFFYAHTSCDVSWEFHTLYLQMEENHVTKLWYERSLQRLSTQIWPRFHY